MRGAKVNAGPFLNCREWQTFLRAMQGTLPGPKVIDAVKSSHAWFIDGAAKTSNWLLAGGGFKFQRP
jgi:hypothetical protein